MTNEQKRRGRALPLPEVGALYGKGELARKVTKLIPCPDEPGKFSNWMVMYEVPAKGIKGSCVLSRFRSWEAIRNLRPVSAAEQERAELKAIIKRARQIMPSLVIKPEGYLEVTKWCEKADSVLHSS